jgi:hypothetical protein
MDETDFRRIILFNSNCQIMANINLILVTTQVKEDNVLKYFYDKINYFQVSF